MFVIWQSEGQDIHLCYIIFPWVYLCPLSHNLAHKWNLTFCETVFLLTVTTLHTIVSVFLLIQGFEGTVRPLSYPRGQVKGSKPYTCDQPKATWMRWYRTAMQVQADPARQPLWGWLNGHQVGCPSATHDPGRRWPPKGSGVHAALERRATWVGCRGASKAAWRRLEWQAE